MVSNRWRSCFTDVKVQWSHSRRLHGKPTDHGLLLAKFRWRLGKRTRKQRINWRALKPVKTVGDEAVNVNSVLDSFEQKCQAQWESTGQYVARGDPLVTLNWVTTCVGKLVLPPEERVVANRMTPSASSLAFAEERAAEIERGTTPQRVMHLHRKMSRFRRRDHRQWFYWTIGKLSKAVKESRWCEARTWSNLLRGVRRKARIMPSSRYRGGGVISTDREAAEQWMLYMKDLYVRRLADRLRFGGD